jgi:hypothetical protein
LNSGELLEIETIKRLFPEAVSVSGGVFTQEEAKEILPR